MNQPILVASCDERMGRYPRIVSLLDKTQPINFFTLYNGLSKVPNFLKEKPIETMDELLPLLDDDCVILGIDNVGAAIAVFEPSSHTVHVHMTFWDKVLRGREDLCKAILRWIQSRFPDSNIWTLIPRTARTAIAFAIRLGFMEYTVIDLALFDPEEMAFLFYQGV